MAHKFSLRQEGNRWSVVSNDTGRIISSGVSDGIWCVGGGGGGIAPNNGAGGALYPDKTFACGGGTGGGETRTYGGGFGGTAVGGGGSAPGVEQEDHLVMVGDPIGGFKHYGPFTKGDAWEHYTDIIQNNPKQITAIWVIKMEKE